jgi:hypothetical protein
MQNQQRIETTQGMEIFYKAVNFYESRLGLK